jgi:hydrogenase maturation protease
VWITQTSPQPVPARTARTLVVGLGNPLVSDDGVGLKVVGRLRELLANHDEVDMETETRGGLLLMERMVGYERVILIDAVRSGAAPGTIHRLCVDGVPTQHSASAHDANLATALAVGRAAGYALPTETDVQIIGIEVKDVETFSDRCTPAVEAAVPHAAQAVLDLLANERGG